MPLHPCNIFGLRSCELNNSVSVVLLFSVIQIPPNLQFYEHFEKMRLTQTVKIAFITHDGSLSPENALHQPGVVSDVQSVSLK